MDVQYLGHQESIAGASKILGVSRSTVYRLIDQDELQRVHIGRRALITGESLLAYRQRLVDADSRRKGAE